MSKTSLGDLKLSPLKENGKFVFINNEVRVNGKLNKGDYIKIFVDSYEMKDGKYILKGENPSSKLVVRGLPIQYEPTQTVATIDELYQKVSEMYRNQFYFGKTEI